MKIVKMEFKSATSSCLFCEITTVRKTGLFRKEEITETRTVLLRIYGGDIYSPIPTWQDTGQDLPSHLWNSAREMMILEYEKNKSN